jgi:hypothetical protein
MKPILATPLADALLAGAVRAGLVRVAASIHVIEL